jgi:hypothetical protein
LIRAEISSTERWEESTTRNAFAAHQQFRLLEFLLAGFQGGIFAVRPAFGANLGQSLRRQRQAAQLGAVGLEDLGRPGCSKFSGVRVVGDAQAVLHGHVQRSGRLAAARHADQDQIGPLVFLQSQAIVRRQGEIHRVDAGAVGVRVFHAMETAAQGFGRIADLAHHHAQEVAVDVHHQGAAGIQGGARAGIGQRGKHEGDR